MNCGMQKDDRNISPYAPQMLEIQVMNADQNNSMQQTPDQWELLTNNVHLNSLPSTLHSKGLLQSTRASPDCV